MFELAFMSLHVLQKSSIFVGLVLLSKCPNKEFLAFEGQFQLEWTLIPSPAMLVSQQSKPWLWSSFLTADTWPSVWNGVIRAKANPPPPAPVSLAWSWPLVIHMDAIWSRHRWDTPNADSRPWLTSISCWNERINKNQSKK